MKRISLMLAFSFKMNENPAKKKSGPGGRAGWSGLESLAAEKLVESGSYAFHVTRLAALSPSETMRNVTGQGYRFTVTPEKIVSQLPAEQAVTCEDACLGIQPLVFTLDCPPQAEVRRTRKGRWIGVYRLTAGGTEYEYALKVKKDGFARLRVVSGERKIGSYYGEITDPDKPKAARRSRFRFRRRDRVHP